jgi:hypothetical protein
MAEQNLTLVRLTGSSRYNPNTDDDGNTYFAFIRRNGADLIVPTSDPRWTAWPETGFGPNPAHLLRNMGLDPSDYRHWAVAASHYVLVEQPEPKRPEAEYPGLRLVDYRSPTHATRRSGIYYAIPHGNGRGTSVYLVVHESDPRYSDFPGVSGHPYRQVALERANLDPTTHRVSSARCDYVTDYIEPERPTLRLMQFTRSSSIQPYPGIYYVMEGAAGLPMLVVHRSDERFNRLSALSTGTRQRMRLYGLNPDEHRVWTVSESNLSEVIESTPEPSVLPEETAHQRDLRLISERFQQEAQRRNWCSEWDGIVRDLNTILSQPMQARAKPKYEVTVTVEVPVVVPDATDQLTAISIARGTIEAVVNSHLSRGRIINTQTREVR